MRLIYYSARAIAKAVYKCGLCGAERVGSKSFEVIRTDPALMPTEVQDGAQSYDMPIGWTSWLYGVSCDAHSSVEGATLNVHPDLRKTFPTNGRLLEGAP
jgi:hypothetical protein